MLDHGSVLTRPCVVTVHFTSCRHVPEATICPERHTSRNGSAWQLSRGVFKASGAELGGPRRLEMGMEMFKGSGGGKDIALTQAVRDIQWPRIRKEKPKYLLMWTGGFPLNSDPLTACTYCVLRDFESLEFGHVPRDQLRSPISPLHLCTEQPLNAQLTASFPGRWSVFRSGWDTQVSEYPRPPWHLAQCLLCWQRKCCLLPAPSSLARQAQAQRRRNPRCHLLG